MTCKKRACRKGQKRFHLHRKPYVLDKKKNKVRQYKCLLFGTEAACWPVRFLSNLLCRLFYINSTPTDIRYRSILMVIEEKKRGVKGSSFGLHGSRLASLF